MQQAVEAPVVFEDLLVEFRIRLRGRGLEVARHDDRIGIRFVLDRVENRFQLLLISSQQDHIGAMSRERARRAAADAVTRAGHEDGSAGQQIFGWLVAPVLAGGREFSVHRV